MDSSNSTTKYCPRCKIEYSATRENFNSNKSRHDGLSAYCRSCDRKRGLLYRQTHAEITYEQRRAQSRRYKRANRDKINEYNRRYREANPEKIAEGKRRWRQVNHKAVVEYRQRYRRINHIAIAEYRKRYEQANHEKIRALKHRRRARELNASGSYTAEDVRTQVRAQTDKKGKLRCWWCGKIIKGNYHIDHRIPLSKGGSNDVHNICVAHGKCNLSKNNKLPHEYNGRLL